MEEYEHFHEAFASDFSDTGCSCFIYMLLKSISNCHYYSITKIFDVLFRNFQVKNMGLAFIFRQFFAVREPTLLD